MKIRVTDLRNFKTPTFTSTNELTGEASKTKVSSQVYILRDCNFNFYNTQNHTETLSIEGSNVETSKISFDIYYKSIEREIQPFLINPGYNLNNKLSSGKGVSTEVGFDDAKNLAFKKPSSIISIDPFKTTRYNLDENVNQQVNFLLDKQKKDKKNKIENSLGITDLKAAINKGIKTVEQLTPANLTNFAREKALSILSRARNALFNLAISEIKAGARSITPPMQPENVYLSDASKVNILELKAAGENLLGTQIPSSWGELKNSALRKGLNLTQ
jgi:hypothetical protein